MEAIQEQQNMAINQGIIFISIQLSQDQHVSISYSNEEPFLDTLQSNQWKNLQQQVSHPQTINDDLKDQFYPDQQQKTTPNQPKNCKLHIGNLPVDIQEEQIRKAFQQYGIIKEIKVIRKNSQGVITFKNQQLKQPLKDYCYGFLLMQEGEGAIRAIEDFKSNNNQLNWSVAYSKDKNEDGVSASTAGQKKSPKKSKEKDDKTKKKKDKKKDKAKKSKKKRVQSSSSSSDRSRYRSKQRKSNKRRKASSSSSPSQPKRSALIPVQNAQIGLPGIDQFAHLTDMLFMNPETLQQMVNPQTQSQQQFDQQITNQILVRELFISGIPLNKASADLQKTFSYFGIIERIDIFPKQQVKYAYVKFKRLECAQKAYNSAAVIAQHLESNGQVKIYYSDPFRRTQIVGNAEDVEKDDELLPILFIGYPSNPNYTVDEKYLKHLAEKYGGAVKALAYRKADPQLRTFVLIEFFELQHTKRCRRKFCQNKVNFLGDQKCDVSILSILPNKQMQIGQQQQGMPPFQMMNQQQAMQQMKPQFQQYNQHPGQFQGNQFGQKQGSPAHVPPNLQQMPYNQGMIPQPHPINNQMMGVSNQGYNPQSFQHQFPQQQQFMGQQNFQQQFQKSPGQQANAQTQVSQQQQQRNYYNYQNQQDQFMRMGQNEMLMMPEQQQLQQYYQQNQQPSQMPVLQQQPRQEENVYWSGFMMRGRQHRLGIDAKILSAQDPKKSKQCVNLPHHLNVNFKSTLQDAVNKAQQPYAAIMIFTPSSESDNRTFEEYVNYFREKNRAGVVQQSEDYVIYIIPPGTQEGMRLYNAGPLEMIAVYCQK